MKRIIVIGGDGFCGWPTALHLSRHGHDVLIVDNLSRRRIDQELGVSSLTPIASIEDRIAAWAEVSGRKIEFRDVDACAYDDMEALIDFYEPDTVIHFGEQRAAPYSMKGAQEKCFTVSNNINATHNLLVAVAKINPDIHVVHLGTMGVYGYDGDGLAIPEGYLDIKLEKGADLIDRKILYPTNPGSVYHMTKSMDQLLFQFYAKNDGIRITDLHQGIVWGTQTDETRLDERLINRFDYDGDYGTVLNRFLMQAAVGHPLTVHGTGGQTRAFINIQDTVHCLKIAIDNPPAAFDPVLIFNQVTETHRVRDLAGLVARVTNADVAFVDNPRKEAAENELNVTRDSFVELGLSPMTLAEGLLTESLEISSKYADRCDFSMIPCLSTWTQDQKPGVLSQNTKPAVA